MPKMHHENSKQQMMPLAVKYFIVSLLRVFNALGFYELIGR